MRKKILMIVSLVLICLFFFSLNFNNVEAADRSFSDSEYYSSVASKTGNELLEGLATLTTNKHSTRTSYSGLRDALPVTDKDPNKSNGAILDFYSKISTTSWNREHVWPKSLSGGAYEDNKAGADVHHIRPTIEKINSDRGNKKFGEVTHSSSTEYRYSGTLAAYTTSGVWEPLDDVKGDTARIIMYMYMHYSNEISANSKEQYAGGLKVTNVISASNSQAAWNLMMKWNALDPVDAFEANRNKEAYNITGIRNPFIDHPEYANRIWGDGTSPEPVTTYRVTFSIPSGASFAYTDSKGYESGEKIAVPSVDPTKTGYVFEGWYKDSSYRTQWNFNADTITSNLTLYAKFSEINLTFDEIFASLKVYSQLAFNVNEVEGEGTSVVEKTVTYDSFSGIGQISGGDVTSYITSDSSLFTFTYKQNNSGSTPYISSEVRLYAEGGNGSSLEIKAKDGIVITGVTNTPTNGNGGTISINNDGSIATIQNTASTANKSTQVRFNSITITYETEGAGTSYEIKDNQIELRYVLVLNKANYNKYLATGETIKMYVNDQEVEFNVVLNGDDYYLTYNIKANDLSTVYAPKFTFADETISISGYSIKTLASYYLTNLASNSLVKQYKSCLTEIANS